MAVKFTKVCGSNRPRTKLDFGRVTKKVTKISNPGCCDFRLRPPMSEVPACFGDTPGASCASRHWAFPFRAVSLLGLPNP